VKRGVGRGRDLNRKKKKNVVTPPRHADSVFFSFLFFVGFVWRASVGLWNSFSLLGSVRDSPVRYPRTRATRSLFSRQGLETAGMRGLG
jgi:hypothetical protein